MPVFTVRIAMKAKLHHDVWISAALIIFSVAFFSLTISFPKQSAVFPRFFLVGLLLFSLIILAGGIRKTKLLKAADDKGNCGKLQGKEKNITFDELKNPLVGLAFIIAYIALINILGFFVSTALFLASLMLKLKIKNYLLVALTTIGVTAFVYVLFVSQLKLIMPKGILF